MNSFFFLFFAFSPLFFSFFISPPIFYYDPPLSFLILPPPHPLLQLLLFLRCLSATLVFNNMLKNANPIKGRSHMKKCTPTASAPPSPSPLLQFQSRSSGTSVV